MTPEKWDKVSELFHSASELPAEERAAFLDAACDGDSTLRAEIESLLAAGTEAGDFISKPIAGNFIPEFAEHLKSLSPGSILGHYRIERAIGSGGMGEVYLAADTKLNRLVALKTLPPSFVSDPNFLRRFTNEAQATATLNHPNVATVYSVEEFDGIPFITMEFVDGQTLDHVTPDDGLEIDKFLEWFGPIADALAHAHEKGVIHRDIKPSNIMISIGGTPKILDFGLAQIEHSLNCDSAARTDITAPGQIIGTPSYMSPEQAEGSSVDQRSDIFSFGTVMYEALTGKRPFRGTSQGMIVRSVIDDDPEPISRAKPAVPSVIAKMVSKCLQKLPGKRFRSMREIRSILKDAKAASDSGISMNSFARRFYREAASSSKLWWASAALLVLVLSVSGWYFFSHERQPQLSFANITLRKLSQSNNVVYAHITPDGNSVAYTTIENREDRSLWIRRISERNAIQLLPPRPVEFWGGFSISNDGSAIYYVMAERAAKHGTLYKISSNGGPARKIADTVNDLGSISPDGERLLFVRYGENTELISAKASDGSDERVLHTVGQSALFRDPQFSVNGKNIYLIRFERIAGVEYWSLIKIPAAGGNETVIIPKQRPRLSEIAVLRDGTALLVNATDPVTNLPQIYHLSLSDKKLTRVTNDLNSYFGISVDSAGQKIVTSQRFDAMALWTGEMPNYSEMRPITPEPNAYLKVEWTVDGRLVYDAIDNNRPHIYIVDKDGKNLQQLTPSESHDSQPRPTPDGRYIIFTSDRTGQNTIWRMNSDGSNPVQISPTNGVAEGPELSADGKFVYFTFVNENIRSIGKVPVNGGQMVFEKPDTEQFWVPSPSGKSAAFIFVDRNDGKSKVGIAKIGGGEAEYIVDVWPMHVLKWSKDEKSIIYREREAGENPYASLWEHNLEKNSKKLLFNISPDILRDTSWSADGKHFAVLRGKLVSDAVMMSNIRPGSPSPQ
jgi:serine/threonine protein kinase